MICVCPLTPAVHPGDSGNRGEPSDLLVRQRGISIERPNPQAGAGFAGKRPPVPLVSSFSAVFGQWPPFVSSFSAVFAQWPRPSAAAPSRGIQELNARNRTGQWVR